MWFRVVTNLAPANLETLKTSVRRERSFALAQRLEGSESFGAFSRANEFSEMSGIIWSANANSAMDVFSCLRRIKLLTDTLLQLFTDADKEWWVLKSSWRSLLNATHRNSVSCASQTLLSVSCKSHEVFAYFDEIKSLLKEFEQVIGLSESWRLPG